MIFKRTKSPDALRSRGSGASASAAGFGGGVTRERVDRFPVEPSLRSQLEALTDALHPHETGLLISLDEVHTAGLADVRQITQAVQHAFREGRELALVAAGLPSAVQDVLSDEVMTFLRRAERFTLGAVALDDGPSRMSAIADRLGADANYVGQYRLRLISAGLVEPAGHGRVEFTLPYLRDYLREHVAAMALGGETVVPQVTDRNGPALPPGMQPDQPPHR
jgi:hypothetical protein